MPVSTSTWPPDRSLFVGGSSASLWLRPPILLSDALPNRVVDTEVEVPLEIEHLTALGTLIDVTPVRKSRELTTQLLGHAMGLVVVVAVAVVAAVVRVVVVVMVVGGFIGLL